MYDHAWLQHLRIINLIVSLELLFVRHTCYCADLLPIIITVRKLEHDAKRVLFLNIEWTSFALNHARIYDSFFDSSKILLPNVSGSLKMIYTFLELLLVPNFISK